MSAYPGISHFELSQDILGHVILGHGVHHKVLVSGRPLCWPVLVAFFLSGVKNRIPQWATTFSSYTSFIVFIPRIFQFILYRLLESWYSYGESTYGISYKLFYNMLFCSVARAGSCAKKRDENKHIHTLPISLSLVSITTIVELCSQSILQKSSVVSASGPCVAM